MMLRKLLDERVILGSGKVPAPDNPCLLDLSSMVQQMRTLFLEWQGDTKDELDQRDEIKGAIQKLVHLLPKIRSGYVEQMQFAEKIARDSPHIPHSPKEFVEETRSDLVAFEELVASLQNAVHRGIPHVFGMYAFSPVIKGRTDFDEMLFRAFKSSVSRSTNAAGYRFVLEMTPYITGEQTSLEAVRKSIERQKFRKEVHPEKPDKDI